MSIRNYLTSLKNEEGFSWLGIVDKNVRGMACRDLHDAFDRFFKKQNGYPKFKKKGKCRFSCSITGDVIKFRSLSNVKLGKFGDFNLAEEVE